MTSLETYIDGLEISYPAYTYTGTQMRAFRGPGFSGPDSGGPANGTTKDNTEQAFIADKSIVSFVSAISADLRTDILNSILLAQLAANKKAPDFEDIIDWYNAFIDVLSKVGGWVVESGKITTFESADSLFEVQEAVIKILTAAFGNNYIALIEKTLAAIGKLADGDGKITAFDKNTRIGENSCFQVGLAVETNGVVTLQMGTFLVTASDTVNRILFIKTSKDTASLQYISNRATFDQDIYAIIRDKVRIKLSDQAEQYLNELDLSPIPSHANS